MEVERDKMSVTAMYRGKQYAAEVPVDATVGLLGKQLSQLTGVALHTMRLLVPKARGAPASALHPASEPHSSSPLQSSGIPPGAVVRMMGVSSEELKEVTQPVKEERVLGFEEEEARRRLRRQQMSQTDAKSLLPKGSYTFHDFRTLEFPFMKLTPPAENARAIMYRLARDPGIVAIMNKHKWQVGMMTELAPEGYVGISPKCILGFNKNRGEEISLRLRTDDLQGFRKYASIKKTLLHELAHMVHDEHDEHFHALDKQLNREAIDLDWTSTTGRTVGGVARSVASDDDDELMDAGGVKSGHKLGGSLPPTANVRNAAAQAAMLRLERNKLASDASKLHELDPDEKAAAAADDVLVIAEGQAVDSQMKPGADEALQRVGEEPDSDEAMHPEEPDPDDTLHPEEPDPDDTLHPVQEPDPDDTLHLVEEPDPDDAMGSEELDPDEDGRDPGLATVDDEIARIQDATSAAVARLESAIATLRQQATPAETATAVKSLSTIVSNLINNPNDDKYKLVRKGNPRFRDRVARFQGAVEFLQVVGFAEGECAAGAGGTDCFVLKRSDPGLLWLARSMLEPLLA